MNQEDRPLPSENAPETPCLVVDLDVIAEAYDAAAPLSAARQHLSMPSRRTRRPRSSRCWRGRARISTSRAAARSSCASANGVAPDRLSFGNTIKKERDIAFAYRGGACGCSPSTARPSSTSSRARRRARGCSAASWSPAKGAEWPLSRKFGCAPEMAVELLRQARELGLDPYGVSFHVGSQQTDLGQWDGAIGAAAQMFSALAEADINLRMVNIGGGFPAHYRGEVPTIERYAQAVMAAMTRHFGNDLPEIIIEPGRSLVGDAGVIQSEVVLIAEKGDGDDKRWVYLDVGKFNGLAETMDESIKYRIVTPGRGGPAGPVVLAGPTCDSADILYEQHRVPAAARPRGRRQGRDPGGRRLYRELRLGRVQRLSADADLLHLSE